MLLRIDERLEFLDHLKITQLYGAYFRKAAGVGIEAGSFHVEYNYLVVNASVGTALYKRRLVVDEVRLHTVYRLELCFSV